MKTILTLSVLFLASCASVDIDGSRVGLDATAFRAKASAEYDGQKFTSEDPGDTVGGSVEITNHVRDDLHVGLRGSVGAGAIESVDVTNYDVEGVARWFLTGGELRPYLTGSIGYRRAELQDEFFGSGGADMLTLGAGVGAQYELGSGWHAFAEVEYQGAFGNDFLNHGVGGTVGFGLDF